MRIHASDHYANAQKHPNVVLPNPFFLLLPSPSSFIFSASLLTTGFLKQTVNSDSARETSPFFIKKFSEYGLMMQKNHLHIANRYYYSE